MLATQSSGDDFGCGDGDDEFATPFADFMHLIDDLLFEVPRQNKHVVGLRFKDFAGSEDRNVSAREELALFVWITVDGAVEEIGPDTAIIEESVTFSGSAIAGDAFALAFGIDEELEQTSFRLLHLFIKGGVSLHDVQAGVHFTGVQVHGTLSNRTGTILDV